MMCHRIGWPPISTIGLGLIAVSSDSLEPIPPASSTTFMPASPSGHALQVAGRPIGDPLLHAAFVEQPFRLDRLEPLVLAKERLDRRDRIVRAPVRPAARRPGQVAHD